MAYLLRLIVMFRTKPTYSNGIEKIYVNSQIFCPPLNFICLDERTKIQVSAKAQLNCISTVHLLMLKCLCYKQMLNIAETVRK